LAGFRKAKYEKEEKSENNAVYRDINKSQTVACKKNKNGRTSWGILNHSPAFSNRYPVTFSKASRPENGKTLFSASKTG
jgi:hypothetical protein